ncbi:MAG: 2-phosphosulfolactate phosphatase [Thermoplasmataceae archaeon]
MKITILDGRKEDKFGSCVKVLVDIFRSTTTIPIMFQRGVVSIIPTKTISDARLIKKQHPEYITVGERYGIKVFGFDFNNSPYEIKQADLSGKIAVFTSTNGTRVLHKIKGYGSVYLGSFVNFGSLVDKIEKEQEIEIVVSSRPDGKADEDYIFAEFLENYLQGGNLDFEKYKNRIRKSQGAKRLLLMGAGRDIEASLEINSCQNVPLFQDGRLVPLT